MSLLASARAIRNVTSRGERVGFRPDIEGIRGLSVLAVIGFHANLSWLSGGYLGVDVFFVVSGFLITGIISSALDAGTFDLGAFYLRRVRRILPGLVIVILVTAPFCLNYLAPDELRRAAISALTSVTFGSNFYYLFDVNYFDAGGVPRPFLHSWSLSVEAQFYLVFPLILTALRKLSKHNAFLALTALGVISLLAFLVSSPVSPSATFYLSPYRMWEFIAGGLLAIWAQGRVHSGAGKAAGISLPSELVPLLGLALIIVSFMGLSDLRLIPGLPNVVAVAGTVAVLTVPSSFTSRALGVFPLRLVGLTSYSLYLVHYPIISIAQRGLLAEAQLENPLGVAMLTLAAAVPLYVLIERPFRGGGRFWRPKDRAIAGAAALIGVMSAAVLLSPFPLRHGAPEDEQLLVPRNVRNDFTWSRMKALESAPFVATDPRQKILVIGDSYAGDLLNAVFLAGLDRHFQFSTVNVSSRCGNLYTDEDIFRYQSKAAGTTCDPSPYLREVTRQRLREADQIWLVSSWRTWVAQRLQASIDRLKAEFGHPVVVFGRKSFGRIDIRSFADMPPEDRIGLTVKLAESDARVNDILSGMQGIKYVDLQDLICGSAVSCKPFDEQGNLIAFDAGHVTEHGAERLGRALATDSTFLSLVTSK